MLASLARHTKSRLAVGAGAVEKFIVEPDACISLFKSVFYFAENIHEFGVFVSSLVYILRKHTEKYKKHKSNFNY